MRQPVVINWGVSSFFGWGVYGLNLALQWANDPDIELTTATLFDPSEISIDPLQSRALQPFFIKSKALWNILPGLGTSRCRLECPVLSDIDPTPPCLDYWISGTPTIGVVFIEAANLSAGLIERARSVPLVVAGSDWNKRILNAHGIDNVVTVLQGTDPAQFHPAPANRWFGDRFCVFSGGKLEFRKAQDIVLAAFRIFAKRHKEALLVTAWHSPWPHVARGIDRSGLASPVVFTDQGTVDAAAWAAANEIDSDQFLDLGVVPNRDLPSILREMDVAVFPNRCEGGTNLVAMECMACGLPVILSRNTGHLDLIDGENCFPLDRQAPLDGDGAGFGDLPGWGESSIEEVVERLEQVFANRPAAQHRGALAAKNMMKLTWKHTAGQLKALILDQARGAR